MLLGETWALAESVLPQMCLLYLAMAISNGALVGLKAMAHSGTVLGITLIQAPLFLALGTLGAATVGLQTAAAGMVVAQFVGTAVTWWGLRLRSRRRQQVLPHR